MIQPSSGLLLFTYILRWLCFAPLHNKLIIGSATLQEAVPKNKERVKREVGGVGG
jgi:hypothetical protein